MWFKSLVYPGHHLGKKIGFPTINLDSTVFPSGKIEGVYLCRVRYLRKIYSGLLYFGPRLILGEKNIVLEIYIDKFHQNIYGKTVSFLIGKYLRPPIAFNNAEELKSQIKIDMSSLSH